MALYSLPRDSGGFRAAVKERLELVKQAGFEGVQFADPATPDELACCRSLALGVCGSGRINQPHDAETLARDSVANGYECVTLHVGWGLESDEEAAQLIENVLEASNRHGIPMYFETHRATICQDMWRTVQFVMRFPEMRFNADFSHWYAGQEMVYGGFEKKLDFIRPVIERVRFIHGRLASPGCIQVPFDRTALYTSHFQQLWTECFRHFLSVAGEGGRIYFTPELLAPDIFYARTFRGLEETDRWNESLKLKEFAENCFECARSC